MSNTSTAPIWRVPGGRVRHRIREWLPFIRRHSGYALCGFYGWQWQQVAETEKGECRECARRAAGEKEQKDG